MRVTETSILASLAELKSIEQQRVADERKAAAAEDAAREELKRTSIQRQIAEAEARRESKLADEARERAARDAEERAKQTAIAIAEVEARAREEAALENARLAQEMELRRAEVARTRPVALIAVIAALVLGAGGLGAWIVRQSSELADQRALIDTTHREQAEWQRRANDYATKQHQAEEAADAAKIEIEALRHEVDAITRQLHDRPVAKPPVHVVPPPAGPTKPPTIQIPSQCKTSALC